MDNYYYQKSKKICLNLNILKIPYIVYECGARSWLTNQYAKVNSSTCNSQVIIGITNITQIFTFTTGIPGLISKLKLETQRPFSRLLALFICRQVSKCSNISFKNCK